MIPEIYNPFLGVARYSFDLYNFLKDSLPTPTKLMWIDYSLISMVSYSIIQYVGGLAVLIKDHDCHINK
jgi:hypothetical protein